MGTMFAANTTPSPVGVPPSSSTANAIATADMAVPSWDAQYPAKNKKKARLIPFARNFLTKTPCHVNPVIANQGISYRSKCTMQTEYDGWSENLPR